MAQATIHSPRVKWDSKHADTYEPTPPVQRTARPIQILLRRPGQEARMERLERFTGKDARHHVLTFGKYNGFTLAEVTSGDAAERIYAETRLEETSPERLDFIELHFGETIRRSESLEDLKCRLADDGVRYLDYLLGEFWLAPYTRRAINAHLSNRNVARQLDMAIAAKDGDDPALYTAGVADAYDLLPSYFDPSDYDTSNDRWLGYRPGGKWQSKIVAARKADTDPTPDHFNLMGNIGDRDDGDDGLDGDDDGWVDFVTFEDDELWRDFQPRKASLRNSREAWDVALRLCNQADAIMPADAPHSLPALRLAIDAYHALRRETIASLFDIETGKWFSIVDQVCRDVMTDTLKAAKGRLVERASSLGLELADCRGTLTVVERQSLTDCDLAEALLAFAAIFTDTSRGIYARDCEPQPHMNAHEPAKPKARRKQATA